MSTEERNVYGIEAPLLLAASHAIANPGFQSARRGKLVRSLDPADDHDAEIVHRDLTILGTPLAKLTLGVTSGETRRARFDFDRPMTQADAFAFLQRFADAWSAALADTQRDPWYGNLYVDIRWAGVKALTAQSGGMSASMEMTSTEHILVDAEQLARLHWSPLTDVFVEGMKATQPKSKFLFWFVILEELEKRGEFASLFTPMFTENEAAQLREVVRDNAAALRRLDGLLNNPATTLEGRPAKLARILEAIGLTSVQALSRTVAVDKALCATLIEQRNKVAHKGSTISTDLLYNVLFPLSRAALAYMVRRDATGSGGTQPAAAHRAKPTGR